MPAVEQDCAVERTEAGGERGSEEEMGAGEMERSEDPLAGEELVCDEADEEGVLD